ILCFGGTTTLTVVGNNASTYSYRLINRTTGPDIVNTTGIFPNRPKTCDTVVVSGKTINHVCDTTLHICITQPDPNPVKVTCPGNQNISACKGQHYIDSAFAVFKSGFFINAGTGN